MALDDPDLVRVFVEGGIAHVSLNRPDKRNAFDVSVAAALEEAFRELAGRSEVRAVVLRGEGRMFCAGADLRWMRRVADASTEENLREARIFQSAFETIDRFPRPVVGRVHGAALGGGVGLVAVCDVVVAAETTRLGFPEVRVGLVPGVVTPYVVRKIGLGQARRLFLTGEPLDAEEAWRLGLVHYVVSERDLDGAVETVLTHLAAGSPDGLRRAKRLVEAMACASTPEAADAAACEAIVDALSSADGREGVLAFLERRRPRWQV